VSLPFPGLAAPSSFGHTNQVPPPRDAAVPSPLVRIGNPKTCTSVKFPLHFSPPLRRPCPFFSWLAPRVLPGLFRFTVVKLVPLSFSQYFFLPFPVYSCVISPPLHFFTHLLFPVPPKRYMIYEPNPLWQWLCPVPPSLSLHLGPFPPPLVVQKGTQWVTFFFPWFPLSHLCPTTPFDSHAIQRLWSTFNQY